jgi:LysM repeat protein
MSNGYDFYFDTPYGLIIFPITPGELTTTSGSKNSVVTLIDEGDVNILKSPSLIEVSFEARFPMRKYPYSRNAASFESYFSIFKQLKEEKQSFRFIVARNTLRGSRTWDTNLLVALEELSINESADEGDDALVSFTLKQYKPYGVKILEVPKKEEAEEPKKETTSTTEEPRDDSTKKTNSNKSYTVKSGDTLWAIAKKYYGKGSEWKKIYNANKSVIEKTAKNHGMSSSQTGHWIFPGTKLKIPK